MVFGGHEIRSAKYILVTKNENGQSIIFRVGIITHTLRITLTHSPAQAPIGAQG